MHQPYAGGWRGSEWYNGSGSDSFVLDGLLGVDDALLVEDAVSTVGTLDSVVGLQLRLLTTLYINRHLLRLPHTYTTWTVLIYCTSIQQNIICRSWLNYIDALRERLLMKLGREGENSRLLGSGVVWCLMECIIVTWWRLSGYSRRSNYDKSINLDWKSTGCMIWRKWTSTTSRRYSFPSSSTSCAPARNN